MLPELNPFDDSGQPHFKRIRPHREKVVIAFFLGVVVAASFYFFFLPYLAYGTAELMISFAIVLAILGIGFLFLTLNKEKVLKRVFGVDRHDLNSIRDSGKELLGSVIKEDWEGSKKHFVSTFNRANAWYVGFSYRNWVVRTFYTLFLMFGGILGTVLIFNQNQLLLKQNRLIENQNRRLDQQTYLIEAQRRSSLVFLLDHILGAVDKELRDDYNKNDIRDLSPQIIGQIVAMSKSLKPYRFLEGDTLIPKALSPERGILLVALVESKLAAATYKAIFRKADFNYADLSTTDLSGVNMEGVKLREANFAFSELKAVNFSRCDLLGANFTGAELDSANLRYALLHDANFLGATLIETDFSYAQLGDANLRETSLDGANFRGANLTQADCRGMFLGVDTTRRSSLRDLTGAELDDVKTDRPELLERLLLQKDTIPGTRYILENYTISPIPITDTLTGEPYYLFKSKGQ